MRKLLPAFFRIASSLIPPRSFLGTLHVTPTLFPTTRRLNLQELMRRNPDEFAGPGPPRRMPWMLDDFHPESVPPDLRQQEPGPGSAAAGMPPRTDDSDLSDSVSVPAGPLPLPGLGDSSGDSESEYLPDPEVEQVQLPGDT